jgi:putative hydrolase of the HAD superfamily
MIITATGIPDPAAIRNIIFDFGGVICNIDISLAEKSFQSLGLKSFDSNYPESARDNLFRQLESGKLAARDFRDILKKYFSTTVSDDQIDAAWNAMILDIPEPRVRLLEKLSQLYRIFILSNSNVIHYQKYLYDFQTKYGYADFDALFEKAFFSFEIHLQKPGREVFEYVLVTAGLKPEETLFIDDSRQHVEGARSAGIQAYHLDLQKGEQILDLFSA